MIPPFDKNHVLPPLIGDANNPHSYSPYVCDIMEFCQRFATTRARIAILKGFVDFRLVCVVNGIRGRQWVDGPFVEDIEASVNRDPRSVIVTSLIEIHSQEEANRLVQNFPAFVDPRLSAKEYKVEHFIFVINQSPDDIIFFSKFWNYLFGHNERGVWKGMLEIPLYENDSLDQMARNFLNSL